MKEKIKEILRSVPIAGKDYPEYIEALSDALIASGVITNKENKSCEFNSDKQIEKMANDICEICRSYTSCNPSVVCTMANIEAEELNAKGYRKSSEVAREIFAEIEKQTARVYNDFMYYQENAPMIAPCVIAFSDKIDIAIAELKKKYTEGEK